MRCNLRCLCRIVAQSFAHHASFADMKPVAGGFSRPHRKKVRDGNASQEEDIVHRSFVDLSFGPIRNGHDEVGHPELNCSCGKLMSLELD